MNDILGDLLQFRRDVLYAVGFALAVLVTAHALLRKRDVASAAGWIGLTWFAPIMGALAYMTFGINRVRTRARTMRAAEAPAVAPITATGPGHDGHLEPLARGIGRLTGHAILPGHAIDTYQNGDAAYPPMLEAIGAARTSIALSSYIFRNDHWGGRFIAALADARDRGVAVRVLIDGVGGGWIRTPAWSRLRARGVPVARFLHSSLPWRMPFINLRSHRKILVVDGATGFTGGMNIADENVLATNPPTQVQDTHFRIRGPAVAQLTRAFAQDWAFTTGEELTGLAWFPPLPPGAGPPARVIDSGPDEDLEKIEFAILQAIACSRERISVMTPYFLPDERLISALGLAAMRGVEVDVIIPEKNNHAPVAWATRANIGPLLDAGVRIWRSPPPFRHSKLMLVDGVWCLIGSCNWDVRSFRLNFELCVEVYDPALAGTLAALVRGCRVNPWSQEELAARSMPAKLRDAAARLMMPYL